MKNITNKGLCSTFNNGSSKPALPLKNGSFSTGLPKSSGSPRQSLPFYLNNRGFSLLEVLVAVSIIGIISAIAVPTYQNYTKETSKTAADTTISNISRAHASCLVLKSFTNCDSLGDIGVSCSDCVDGTDGNSIFCSSIKKDVPGGDFKACVSIEGTKVIKSYGGTAFKDDTFCHGKWKNSGSNTCGSTSTDTPTAVGCDASSGTLQADCGSSNPTNPDTTNCTIDKYTCKKFSANAGDCNKTAGTCSF